MSQVRGAAEDRAPPHLAKRKNLKYGISPDTMLTISDALLVV